MMNPADQQRLRSNFVTLQNDIKEDIARVTEYLSMTGIITESMYERILLPTKTKSDQASELLFTISKRGPNAYQALYDACVQNSLYVSADVLRPDSGPHAPKYTPPAPSSRAEETQPKTTTSTTVGHFDPLPEEWPSEESQQPLKERDVRKITPDDAELKNFYDQTLTEEGRKLYYPMMFKKRARVFIINNYKFDTLSDREGTEKDRRDLEQLFNKFGWDTWVKDNLDCQTMKDVLSKEAQNVAAHEKVDCFLLFILTHGHTGCVYGTDGFEKDGVPMRSVEIKWIRDLFSQNASGLFKKPKVFFIQACQGKNKDKGMTEREMADKKSKSFRESMAGSGDSKAHRQGPAEPTPGLPIGEDVEDRQNDIDLRNAKKIVEEIVPTESSDAYGTKDPTDADLFVAVSTTDGYISWRNEISGTWFIQAVVYIYSRFAYKYDFSTLMTKVNLLVSRGETKAARCKQISRFESSGRAQLYFFPGLWRTKTVASDAIRNIPVTDFRPMNRTPSGHTVRPAS